MASKTVKPEQFATVMTNILNEYDVEVVKATNEALKKTAQADTRELRASSRSLFKSKRRRKKYARSWTFHQTKNELGSKEFTVYNREYQLTHLLEKGHKMWFDEDNHFEGRPHIKPVADRTGKALEDFFKSGMRKVK